MEYYDLAVIGGGWAGINASLKAGSLGLKVCLLEKDLLGGTCLNRGCIPTKYLINYAKIYLKSKSILKEKIELKVDLKELKDKKNALVEKLRLSLINTLKNKNITYINSLATFRSNFEIEVNSSIIKAKNIIIATGAKHQELNFLKFDGKKVISTDEILELERIPSSILIVGAGVVGCEFASLFNILGSQVTLLELMPQILPQEDSEISFRLARIFKKRGIKIYISTDIRNLALDDYEIVLVSVGRTPNIEGLGLEKTDIKLENKRIVTDEYLSTSVEGIYAAGDCINKIMLAHLAAYQGRILVENIISFQKKKITPLYIPNCIFTYPEIARVGLTEEEAKAKNLKFKVNRFDFLGLSMSHILEETEGLIKIISDKDSDNILGASIIGPSATDIVGILTLAMQNNLKLKELQSTIFAHPTMSECITEALK